MRKLLKLLGNLSRKATTLLPTSGSWQLVVGGGGNPLKNLQYFSQISQGGQNGIHPYKYQVPERETK
jgi:hypothetical protein